MTDIQVATPHGDVPLRAWGRTGGDVGILVAHGAGAGHDHPWIAALCDRLVDARYPTWTFEYAYMARGRRAPDRLPKLIDVHQAVLEAVAPSVDSLVLAGKSMGGRVGGHLVAERSAAAAGLVYLGYPLVPIGKDVPRDTTHLRHVAIPQLFISGTRDRMGPIDLIAGVVEDVPEGRLAVVEDGDHSFVPRKASGRTLDDSLDAVVTWIDAWIEERVAG